MEIARAYAERREAFGAPLAERESVQVMLGDLAMQIEVGRLLVMKAAWEIDRAASRRRRCRWPRSMWRTAAQGGRHGDPDQRRARLFEDTVLEWIYRYARQARLVDGADEVHKMILNRHLSEQGAEFYRWATAP
jgi:acyl-CoA dehydrogenase